MRINTTDTQRVITILDEVNLDFGARTSIRKLAKLTEKLSERQRKLMNSEELAKVEEGDPGMMKRLLSKSVWHILLRQASNALAELATHTRQAIPRTPEDVEVLLKASKGDLKSSADRLEAAKLIQRIGEAVEKREAKATPKKK